MGTVIGWLMLKFGLGEKGARVLAYVGLAMLVLALLGTAKCAYDRSVISRHEAKQEAATAKADRKADARAAEQRREDDARTSTEDKEIEEAINEARASGTDPRAAYYKCIQLQQAARKLGKPPADC